MLKFYLVIYSVIKMSWSRSIFERWLSIPWSGRSPREGIGYPLQYSWASHVAQCGRPGFDPWVGKIPGRRERLHTPVFWPREFHRLYEHDWVTYTSLHFIRPHSPNQFWEALTAGHFKMSWEKEKETIERDQLSRVWTKSWPAPQPYRRQACSV